MTNNDKALILMTCHMVESLQLEYMNEENAQNLWVALEEHFGNVHNSLLSDLEVQWQNLRFFDLKTVMEYNAEALCIRSLLHLCEKPITEAQLIEKTLSTFPVSGLMVAKNYRLDVTARGITRFQELIAAMSIAEIHDNILVKNFNLRLVGTKAIPEANYNGGPKGDRSEKNNKGRDNRFECYAQYNRFTQDSKRQNNQRGRGRGGQRVKRGTAHNSRANSRGHAPRTDISHHTDACNRCGKIGHWARVCKAHEIVAKTYRAYRDTRESHLMDHDDLDVESKTDDFDPIHEYANMDAPGFE